MEVAIGAEPVDITVLVVLIAGSVGVTVFFASSSSGGGFQRRRHDVGRKRAGFERHEGCACSGNGDRVGIKRQRETERRGQTETEKLGE